MTLDPLLLDVLACPVDKGPLLWFADEDILYNPRLHKSYQVVDGVPVLLVEEGDGRQRRRARAPDRQGGEGGRARHRARSGVTHPQYLDTLGRVGRHRRPARAVARGRRLGRRRAATTRACRRPLTSARSWSSAWGTAPRPAEAVAAYAAGRASVPIWVGNGYESPAFVGPHTLAFAVSASGGTEETIAAASAARARGARLVVVSGARRAGGDGAGVGSPALRGSGRPGAPDGARRPDRARAAGPGPRSGIAARRSRRRSTPRAPR